MLIGLTGLKQSGKTTAGDFLAHKYKFEHTSFAAPMRKFAMDVLCMNEVQLEFMKEQPVTFLDRQVTPRQFLQRLGTEFGREMIHPDLWVRACLMRVDTNRRTVISDCRFDNEAYAIRAMGGKIVQITRRGQVAGTDTHASEAGIHPALIDYTINNNGERVEAFHADIDALMRFLYSGEIK
jgi:hypothetical protein